MFQQHELAHRFEPIVDSSTVQAAVLKAAVAGDLRARMRLPNLLSAFDEPYRTVAQTLLDELSAGKYVDEHTLASSLKGKFLTRRRSNGQIQELSGSEATSLIWAGDDTESAQVLAYVDILEANQKTKRTQELKQQLASLADNSNASFSDLLSRVDHIAENARQREKSALNDWPSELEQLIFFMRDQNELQQGQDFRGLDSGFQHFNNLCNGLDAGLAVLTAPPSLGKTTLVWQIACQTAEINKVPVVFLSMEQSKEELRVKALSRIAKMAYRDLLRGRLNSNNPDDRNRLLNAASTYGSYAQFLTIMEANANTTVETLRQVAIQKMNKFGSPRCLICVDYLQIFIPEGEHQSARRSLKEDIDRQVTRLRQLARDLKSPVMVISSANRAGYDKTTLDVFKESGGIEYSADIAMILTRDDDPMAEEVQEFRKLNLNIVKNRNGERGKINFKFYPKRAEFIEAGKEDYNPDECVVV